MKHFAIPHQADTLSVKEKPDEVYIVLNFYDDVGGLLASYEVSRDLLQSPEKVHHDGDGSDFFPAIEKIADEVSES